MQRIENSVKRGTPDVEACYNGRCFVVELKALGDADDLRAELTTAQAMFLNARAVAWGASWLLVQVGARRYLLSGRDALRVHQAGRITNAWLLAHSAIPADASALDILQRMTQ